jgi:predicted phosphodiesterase
MTKKRDVVEQYIRKFPDTPNLTLAKKIMKDKPELFPSVETIRHQIRIVKGASGKAMSKYSVPELKENRDDKKNPFKLPESYNTEWEVYYIPHSIKKLLVLSDIHIPYHDIEAITVALKKGKEEKVDGILINGDLIDFHTLSRYEKDPSARSMWEEIEATRDFLDILKSEFKNSIIYYKTGNHCERVEKYLRVKAPELLDCPDFKLDVLLRLGEKKINYIDDKRIIDFCGISILHGHEFFGSPSQSVNPARGLWNKTYSSSMIGHLHKTSSNTEIPLRGSIHATWSLGCLCGLTPEYARINRWNHGFAIIENNGDAYKVNNYMIYNGKVL